MSEIKPALSKEEWEYWTANDGYRKEMLDVGCDAVTYSLHQNHAALAALALYGQPFGFTREDADQLRFIAASDGWESVRAFATSLADRIEALLPPE